MAYVPIPKDLNRVKTKVAFNLTKRQLIGFTLAGLVGIPVYLFMRKFVPNDIAVIFLIVSTLPIFFITLFEKDGLTFEKYFKHIYFHKFYQPKKRVRKCVRSGYNWEHGISVEFLRKTLVADGAADRGWRDRRRLSFRFIRSGLSRERGAVAFGRFFGDWGAFRSGRRSYDRRL